MMKAPGDVQITCGLEAQSESEEDEEDDDDDAAGFFFPFFLAFSPGGVAFD